MVRYGGGMSDEGSGLRELKKRQTRQHISDVATGLFIERGFDEVTIAEVAAAAQVAKMTVTNHFRRKEDLVFDIRDEFVSGPAWAVMRRHAGESVFDALQRHYVLALMKREPAIGLTGPSFAEMVSASVALRASLREMHQQREELLVQTLLDEKEWEETAVHGAAALLVAVYRVLFERAFQRTLELKYGEEVFDELGEFAKELFGMLRPGIGDFARKPEIEEEADEENE